MTYLTVFYCGLLLTHKDVCIFFFWDSVYPLHVVNLPFIYVNVFTKVGTFAKNYLDILLEFNWTRNSCNLFLSLLPHRHCLLDSYCPISLAHMFSIQPNEQYIFYKFQWGDKSVRRCLLHSRGCLASHPQLETANLLLRSSSSSWRCTTLTRSIIVLVKFKTCSSVDKL